MKRSLNKIIETSNKKGNAIIFATVIVFIVFFIGISLLFLSENEVKKAVRSNLQNATFYIAEGGTQKALWELNHDSSYAGESYSTLGKGTYTITVNTPAGQPNQREIIVLGRIGWSRRKIKVITEKIDANITVNSALACGGNVNMGGNANVAGATVTGIVVPVGCTVYTSGSSSVSGTPATSHASFPAFADVFGISMADMEKYATTKYINPGTNATCQGITWVEGNLKASSNDWDGSGILIVNGNFDMSGGDFNGVIYVVGTFRMTGNAAINGSILSQSMADVTGLFGTSDIFYNSTAVQQATNAYPFRIINWQEVKQQVY
ncbi:MAG: hypothetical protein PHD29_07815 [bacterium]|nr:hypothetical protein [bacterium]MDD5354870.1 hypothetical protein [bacterium]MDD5755876.1 hypothetical protein [bacterium]